MPCTVSISLTQLPFRSGLLASATAYDAMTWWLQPITPIPLEDTALMTQLSHTPVHHDMIACALDLTT